MPDKLKDDSIEQIRAGVEALQHDQARRNIEEELERSSMNPDQVFTKREQDAIKRLVHDALVEFFRGYGIKGKNTIVMVGTILTLVVSIVVALKTIGGWVGIGLINK